MAKSYKRKKKKSARALIRESEILLRQQMLERDGYKCLMCGKESYLQMSHIYPKGIYRHMRFELDNVVTHCRACHLFKWHRDIVGSYEWLQKTLDPTRLKKLKKMADEKNKK